MKRLFAIIAVCFLIVSSVGCGTSTKTPKATEGNNATAPLPTESIEPTEPPVPLYQDLAATGTIIELDDTIEGDVISVTLRSVALGSADEYCSLTLDIHNKSDESIVVSDSAYINNYYARGGRIISVNAGQTSTLEFSYSEIGMGSHGGMEVPSSEIGKISFAITVTKGFMTDNVQTVESFFLVHYPNDKETWEAATVRQPKEGETLLLDNEYIKLIARGETKDYFGEKVQSYYLENKTAQDLTIVFDGARGYVASPFEISAGTRILLNLENTKLSAVVTVSDSNGNTLSSEAVKHVP